MKKKKMEIRDELYSDTKQYLLNREEALGIADAMAGDFHQS